MYLLMAEEAESPRGEEPSTVEEGAADKASRVFYALLGLALIVLSAASLYLIYLGYYLEVIVVMMPSWLVYLAINEVDEDRKKLTKFLRPFNIFFTLIVCSTLIAVILAGLYLLFKFVLHLGQGFMGIMSYRAG